MASRLALSITLLSWIVIISFIVGMINPNWIIWWKEGSRILVGIYLFAIFSLLVALHRLVERAFGLEKDKPVPSQKLSNSFKEYDRDELRNLVHGDYKAQVKRRRIIEELVSELEYRWKEPNRWSLQETVKSLDALDWKPNQDAAGAMYWATKYQWDKCLESGFHAQKPLEYFQPSLLQLKYACKSLIENESIKTENALRFYHHYLENKMHEAEKPDKLLVNDILWLRKELSYFSMSVSRLTDCAQGGDIRAKEILVNKLKDIDKVEGEGLLEWKKRKANFFKIVESLDAIGWKPNQDAAGAMYWAIKGRWDKCLESGEQGIKSLKLFHPEILILKEACKSLIESGSSKIMEALKAYRKYIYSKIRDLERQIAEHDKIHSTWPDNYPRDQMQEVIDTKLTPEIRWAEIKMSVFKSEH
jgi:hypothetical protein